MDEVFETAILIQTAKIQDSPLVLLGKEFCGPQLNFMEERLIRNGTICPRDLDRFILTDFPRRR